MYQKNLIEAINKVAPEKDFRILGKQRIGEPWMTSGIMKSSKTLDKKYKKIIGLDSQSDCVTEYKSYRNMLNRVKWKAKLSYSNDKFVEYKNNACKLWQVVNLIIGKHKNKQSIIDYLTIEGVKYYNEIDINNAFGKYFVCIGKKLAYQIDKPDKDAMYYL